VIRLVLFDIDGTLIRTGGAGEKAFARVFETEFNVPNGTARLQFAGRTDPSIVRDFFQHHQIDPRPENFRRFFDNYVFWLDHLLAQLPGRVLPGVHDLIRDWQSLSQPPAIGLLTGNIRLGAQIKLSHYQLWHLFQTGAFGDDHEDRNEIAVIARERGNNLLNETLRSDQILVIGDTPRDIACARAIGAKVLVAATGSYRVEQLASHQPDWLVEDLEQISVKRICR